MPLKHLIREHAVHPVQLLQNVVWRLKGVQSTHPYAFVCGPPRCGTTLIKSMLAAHPNFTAGRQEMTILLSHKNIFHLEHRDLTDDEVAASYRQAGSLAEIYDAIAARIIARSGQANRFVDKVQATDRFAMKLWRRAFRSARFVWIIRDGRDSYCSARKIENFFYTENLQRYACYWRRKARDCLRERNRERVCLVRYEDLVTQPEGEIRRVMKFLGERYDPVQLESYGDTTDLHKYDSRFASVGTPIGEGSVQRWQRELTEQENQAFVDIAGSELGALGYALTLKNVSETGVVGGAAD